MFSSLASFISNRHGKFYASFVVVDLNGSSPQVTITGPFDTERQAEYWSNKWTRLNDKLLKRGEACRLPNMTSVPPDVRVYITECLQQALLEHGIGGLEGKVFGRSFS
jgi:hypothetical protein